jgi:hypothetical protein
VLPQQGDVGQKCQHLAVGATCHRHVAYIPSQAKEAIHNVFELKTTPQLVRYHHASAGFPTKPKWIAAIKNKQYALWLGLSVDAARRHFPELDKTHKGHGRKTPSELWSTKPKEN